MFVHVHYVHSLYTLHIGYTLARYLGNVFVDVGEFLDACLSLFVH